MAQGFPGFSAADMELLRLQDSFEKSQRLQGQGQGQGGQHSNGADFTTNRKHRGPRQGGKAYRILDVARQSDVEREGTGGGDGHLEEGKAPVEKSVESSGLSQKANAGPDSPSVRHIQILPGGKAAISGKKDTESLLPGESTRNLTPVQRTK